MLTNSSKCLRVQGILANRYTQNLLYIWKHCDGLLAFGCVKGFRQVENEDVHL